MTQKGCILAQEIRNLCKLTLSSTIGFSLGFTCSFGCRNFEHLNFLLVFYNSEHKVLLYIRVGEISKQLDKFTGKFA